VRSNAHHDDALALFVGTSLLAVQDAQKRALQSF